MVVFHSCGCEFMSLRDYTGHFKRSASSEVDKNIRLVIASVFSFEFLDSLAFVFSFPVLRCCGFVPNCEMLLPAGFATFEK